MRIAGRAGSLDAALLDINLRDGLVYPLVDHLVADGVPVIFATAYSEGAIPPRYRSLRRSEKPIALAQLVTTLGDLCR
jgi:CheY-like chemotaxis protein